MKSITLKLGLAAFILLSLGLMQGCSNQTENNEAAIALHLKRSNAYMKQGQYKAAIIEAKNALQKQNDNIEARILLAQINLDLGSAKNAADLLKDFVSATNPDAVLLLAEAYINQGKANSAAKTLGLIDSTTLNSNQQAQTLLIKTKVAIQSQDIELAKRHLSQLRNLQGINTELSQEVALTDIRLNFSLQQTAEAEQALNQLLEQYPTHTDALILKARVAYAQNKLEEAENLLTEALGTLSNTDIINNTRIQVLRNLAHVLTRQGRSVEALTYTKIIAEARPGVENSQAQIEQALESYKQGNVEEAEQQLQALYDQNANNYIGTLLGAMKLQQGEYDDAYSYLSENIDPETASASNLNMLTEAQLRQNKPAEVLASIETNVRNNPNNAQHQTIYGLASLAEGKEEQGIAAINKAINIDPSRSRLHLLLAKYYNQKGLPEKATQQLQDAIKSSPDDLTLKGTLINQLFATQQPKQAVATAKGFANDSESLDNQLLYAATLLQVQEIAAAKSIFTKALKQQPDNAMALKGMLKTQLADKKLDEANTLADKLIKVTPNDVYPYRVKYGIAATKEKRDALTVELDKKLANSPDLWAPASAIALNHMYNQDFALAGNKAKLISERAANNPSTKQIAINIWLALAQQYNQRGKTQEARLAIMEALALAPNNQLITAELINLEIRSNNLREADKLLTGLAQSEHPNEIIITQLQGDLATANKQYQEAAEHYKKAWAAQTKDSIAVKLLSTHQRLGNTAAASSFLKEWVSKLPDSSQAHTANGNHQMQNKQTAAAIESYSQAVSLNPNNALALNNLAWLQYEKGDNNNAIKHAQKAYEVAGKNAAIADTYGWILSQTGQAAKALPILEEAASQAPENQEIIEHLQATKAKLKK